MTDTVTIPSIDELVEMTKKGKVEFEKKKQKENEEKFIVYKNNIYNAMKIDSGIGRFETEGWHMFADKNCKYTESVKAELIKAGYEIKSNVNDPLRFTISWKNKQADAKSDVSTSVLTNDIKDAKYNCNIPSIEEMIKMYEFNKIRKEKNQQKENDEKFIKYGQDIFYNIGSRACNGHTDTILWSMLPDKNCKYTAIIKKALIEAGYEILRDDDRCFTISWKNLYVNKSFLDEKAKKNKNLENDDFPSADAAAQKSMDQIKLNKFNEDEYKKYKNGCINLIKETMDSGNFEIQYHDYLNTNVHSQYAVKLIKELKEKGYNVSPTFMISWAPKTIIVQGTGGNVVFGGDATAIGYSTVTVSSGTLTI